jgi:hypothetical protein
MAHPDNTPGMMKMGKRWKVQTYLTEDTAIAIADQAEVCGESVGSIVSAIISKVAVGRNPTPTQKIVAAIQSAAQAKKNKR